MKNHDANNIDLHVDDVEFFANDIYEGMLIHWSATIGFGQYTISKRVGTDKLEGQSEHMDSNDDKSFLRALLSIIADKIKIVE